MADRAWWWLLAWIVGGVSVALIGFVSLLRAGPVEVDVRRYHMAPAQISLLVRVQRNQANRQLIVIADSGEYARRSDEQLEGADAPTVRWIRWRDVPTGDYKVVAVVERGAERPWRAQAWFTVIGVGGHRSESQRIPSVVIGAGDDYRLDTTDRHTRHRSQLLGRQIRDARLHGHAPLSGSVSVCQPDDFFDRPDPIRNADGHRRRDPQRLVNPHEVVVHVMQREHRDVILDLL